MTAHWTLTPPGPPQEEIDQHIKYLNFCSKADNVREYDSFRMTEEDHHTLTDAYDVAKRQIRQFESRWRLEGLRWVPQLSAAAGSSTAESVSRSRTSSIFGRGQSRIPVSAPGPREK